MIRKPFKRSSIFPILILCVAVGMWGYDVFNQGKLGQFFDAPATSQRTKESDPGRSEITRLPGKEAIRSGKYEVFEGCMLASDRGNDGDSFRVKFPDGKAEVMRLYFVDSPESAFKEYGRGRTNHQRIGEQAREMGGITPEQAVEIGKKAKEFTLAQLGKGPFTVFTEWDSPFHDARYHAFIRLSYEGKSRFLDELLVEKGFARIHTKGGTMPDGTSQQKQEGRLMGLEKKAKASRVGAWAF